MTLYRLIGCLGCSFFLSVGLLAKGSDPNVLPEKTQESALFENLLVTKAKSSLGQLMAIPPAQRSFENFFRPWYAIKSTFYMKACELKRAGKDIPAYDEWSTNLLQQIDPDKTFSLALTAYLQQTVNEDIDPYQQFLLDQETKSTEELSSLDRYVSIDGEADEAIASRIKLDALMHNLRNRTYACSESNNSFDDSDFSNTDVLILQGVEQREGCYALYEHLKDHYAHFYMKQSPTGFNRYTTLIACKYAIEGAHWTQFSDQDPQTKDGFFDFVVRSGKTSLGHIYVVNLRSSLSQTQREKNMIQIIHTMHTDLSKASMPPILLGYLGNVGDQNDSAQRLAAAYFKACQMERVGVFLLRSFNWHPSENKSHTSLKKRRMGAVTKAHDDWGGTNDPYSYDSNLSAGGRFVWDKDGPRLELYAEASSGNGKDNKDNKDNNDKHDKR